MAFSPEIQSELDANLLRWPNVSTRKMFGAMVYLIGGRMFAFIYDTRVIVKLRQEEKGEAGEQYGARPFIHGRTGRFGDWMEFPLDGVYAVEGVLPWIRRSFEYVQVAPTHRRRPISPIRRR